MKLQQFLGQYDLLQEGDIIEFEGGEKYLYYEYTSRLGSQLHGPLPRVVENWGVSSEYFDNKIPLRVWRPDWGVDLSEMFDTLPTKQPAKATIEISVPKGTKVKVREV